MDNETVSVIIPTHNRANKVSKAISSVLDQTRPPDEVIVVDDGSQDNTLEVLKEFGDRIRVVRQVNKGVAEARNEGMAKATGQYIAFQDDDDEWYPWKLEVQLQIMKALPEVAMLCSDVDSEGELGRFPRLISKDYFDWFEDNFALTKSDMFPHSVRIADLGISNSAIDQSTRVYYGYIFEHMWVKLFILNSTVMWRREHIVPYPPESSQGSDTFHFVERSKVCVFAYLDLATITYSIFDTDQHLSKRMLKLYGCPFH